MALKKKKRVPEASDNKYVFSLYVAGPSAQSMRAISNIKKILGNFSEKYELKVIDIYEHPVLACEDQIIAAPTLIKKLPKPIKKFIGDLSDSQKIILGISNG
jgi:circadian clock protein KaiB